LLLPEQRNNNGTSSKQLIEVKGGNINLQNVSAMWSGAERNTLNDLNLSLKGDQLVMVVGQVGSGKSSLLHLLISEIKMLEGVFNVSGTISYASQEPWIFPGNVRQNILFGEEFDALRYDQVVTACALKVGFKKL
jgi:ATP-binding cassette subfamily C (CFTR/MRP) protein 4